MLFAITIWILIIALGLFLVWLKSPRGKGVKGEFLVKRKIGKTKENKKYVINNYMIQDGEKSSQIDHIVINENGVFVIETKNYSGIIYGNDNQHEWIQVLSYGRVRNKLHSPIKQNATHIYRLKEILPNDIYLTSIIVFVKNNTDYILKAILS